MVWAGLAMGASVPKNGNNRPLSLLLENFFLKFLSRTVKLSPSSFLDYVIDRLLPVEIILREVKGRYAGLMSRVDSTLGFLRHEISSNDAYSLQPFQSKVSTSRKESLHRLEGSSNT